MSETIRAIGDEVAIFCGLEPYALPLLQRGAVGIVAMAPNIIGKRAVDLYTHAVAGRWPEAFELLHHIPSEDQVKDFLTVYIAQHDRRPPANWDGVVPLANK